MSRISKLLCLGVAALMLRNTHAFAESEAPLTLQDGILTVNEPLLSATWAIDAQSVRPTRLVDVVGHQTYDLAGVSLFKVKVTEGDGYRFIDSSKLKPLQPLKIHPIEAKPGALRLSERRSGVAADAEFADEKTGTQLHWTCLARAGDGYFRQQLFITAGPTNLPVSDVILLDHPLRFPWIDGVTPGSPLISGTMFCGVEDPSATNEIFAGRARAGLERSVPIAAGQTLTVSAVVGVARSGQLRRDFQRYINDERPRPFRPFLHYNSWYDLGYFTPFTERDALGAINIMGSELAEKRGVKLSSFLFDDGWDNHQTLWDFNGGFPDGFAPLMTAARRLGAGLGVWMSPWGGYGKPKTERIKFGKAEGFEIVDNGFALSGPKYYERFRSVCRSMIEKFAINQFKFDGTGNVTSQYPGSKFGTDFDAMISLIGELRAMKPDLYVNLTTGTWPSPFWTRYADSIWRGGDDHTFAGVGTFRQRWITYRDGDEYNGIVLKGPLYPLNSLMLHGIIYAAHAHDLNTDPADDFADEVHDYFGTGTQLQEMYITGALLSAKNWDTLAEAAKWAAANAQTLSDTHWVGGDPNRGQIYGYAAWSPIKGILTLRNPSDVVQSIDLDPGTFLELPTDAAASYEAHCPWSGASAESISLKRGVAHHFELKPFQLLTLEAIPSKP